MKIATLHDGSRDGQLVVVSRDLASAHFAAHVAGTLQQVLDDWNFLSPQLEDLYATLNGGKARHAFAFDPRACLAPLPRAGLWAPGQTLARSDVFLRPVAEAALPELPDLRCEVQACVITADVAAGADADKALDGVRLLLLAASWCTPQTQQTPLASAFSPVAATPDEFGAAWQRGRLALPLHCHRRGALQALTLADASAEADDPGFGARIAALARWQALGAGSLVGGPLLHAGGGWAAGDSLQLACRGPDGQDLLGTLSLHAPAALATTTADAGASQELP